MAEFNAKNLAHRVQGLLQARFRGDLVAAARALGIDADDLRQIVEDETDYPRLDVLSALVRYFGVDACWLVTGEYEWRAHLRVLEEEDENPNGDPRQLLLRLTTRRGDEILRRTWASLEDRIAQGRGADRASSKRSRAG